MNKFIAILLVLIVAVMAWWFWSTTATAPTPDATPIETIMSFADCERAGYPVMESHPRRCALPDGRTYTEEIAVNPTYENASADLIQVELPYPGAVTGKSFTVKGQARGNWFFEASFPVEVVDADGTVLASTHATANGDWMTTEFVLFEAEVKVPDSYIGPATLILRKDNPSGLPENDAAMSFPITIEY